MSGYLASIAREALAAGTSQIDLDLRAQQSQRSASSPVRIFAGLDLGQTSDPTALCTLEQSVSNPDDDRPIHHYGCRHLELPD